MVNGHFLDILKAKSMVNFAEPTLYKDCSSRAEIQI